jgi:hypothetical protein
VPVAAHKSTPFRRFLVALSSLKRYNEMGVYYQERGPMVRRIGLALLALVGLASGCSATGDYMFQYRSVAPFHPADPNELLAELTRGLPARVEIRHYLHHQRTNEMRGLVLVRSVSEWNGVGEAVRRNPRLAPVAVADVRAGGPYLICFSSQPPFVPADKYELLAQLRRGLVPSVKPTVVRSRPNKDGLPLWVVVNGTLGKEVTKYAIYHNPNLKLLQVEQAPPWLWLGRGDE